MAQRQEHGPLRTAPEATRLATDLHRRSEWEPLAALAGEMPAGWGRDWLRVADAVAFALGQLGQTEPARDVLLRAYEIEPEHRRASALAYVHYDALLRHKNRRPRLADPEPYRKAFEHWIGEALRLRPDSLVDHYRLGVYQSSILTRKDVVALRSFAHVARLFDRLPAAERTEQSRHFKTYIRALYGAARSAYRLRRFPEARRYIFRCIRLDRERHHQEPVFELFLAAKILVAEGRLADAERALRLALEVRHDGTRDFVYALLSTIALAQNRVDDAAAWIELHVPPHHRKPYVWRLLGDCELRRDRPERAIKLYKSSLLKDHAGRHKTLCRIGRAHEQTRRIAEARRAYEQATDFRRRRYLNDDPEAIEALARLYEEQGDLDGARRAYTRMERLPTLAAKAKSALARLAG